MPSADLRTGDVQRADYQFSPLRGDKRGALVTVGAGGRYQEAAYRGQVYCAAAQAAVTLSAALTTTFTGLCLLNPNASGVNFAILTAGVGDTTAAGAITTLGLMGGWSSTDQPATTVTNVNITHGLLDKNWKQTGSGVVISGCTLNVAPRLLLDFASWGTTTTNGSSTIYPDINGQIIVAPGGYVALYATTSVAVVGHISYAEIPL